MEFCILLVFSHVSYFLFQIELLEYTEKTNTMMAVILDM
jgi:hypothetical protein